MAAADIPALLAEADSQLAIDAGAATDNMAIVDSTAMATSDAMTTWSETGMNLTIGNTVTTGIAAEATASIDIAALNPPDFPARAASVVGEPIVVWGIEPIVPETAATAIEGEVSSVFTTSKNEIQAAELQAKSTWTVGSAFKMAGKVALYTIGAAMALDWIGKKLVSIIQVSIEAANPPPWAQSLTAAQKKDLKAVTSAVPRLTILMQGWHAQWSTYSKSFSNSLGNITVNVGGRTTSVPVLYIIYYAFSDMEGALNNAKNAISSSTVNFVDVMQAVDYIFIFLADVYSLYNLKKKSQHLQAQDFPAANDKVEIDKIILSFPNGLARVKAVGVSYLRFVSTNAIKTFFQVQMIHNIFTEIQNIVLPQMKAAAKHAYIAAAQAHMNKEKSAIQALAWVPGAGMTLARQKLAKERGIAAQLGAQAAKTAAQAKMHDLLPLVKESAAAIMKGYAKTDQHQLKMIVNLAIQDATGQIKATAKDMKKPA
ncbi:PREDICTED: uncharacterized protein LOC109583699 [Amphimedon queenslandica]|uniref:Uncharacterized protein n=1 Tax=Amphimedon queenslandica TaxID=400682 RepID=A0A1X7UFL5_AMPQE|nr:PREDICTED: uncharacterized protein LOC109583699 [Amphimedon queenslandica]|eukprot:XP_019854693.1 PREDICTED: uncharacterized protein LOC109583699 [Amphimedon queenslandica]